MVNVFKHARGCTEVYLAVELLPSHFMLKLINNGSSFDNKAISTGEGLKNMRKRAEKIGGELIINSSNNHTIVTLRKSYA